MLSLPLPVMGTSKKKGKAVQSDDEEADVVETFLTATPSAPATKLKKPTTSTKIRFGKLRLMNAFKAKSGVMKKVGKKVKAGKSTEIKYKNQAGTASQPRWLYRSAFCWICPTAGLW
jgi:hypothetical protein